MITKCQVCNTDLFLNYEPEDLINCPECGSIFIPKQLSISELWETNEEEYDEDCVWDAFMVGNKATYTDLHRSSW
jgi:DNA-directed RNA polymerase subunit RPC12/RpoP